MERLSSNKSREIFFYFDVLHLLSRNKPYSLRESLPLYELEKFCKDIAISEPYNVIKHHGYHSSIFARDVRPGFLELLKQFDIYDFIIVKLEVAMDLCFDNKYDASFYAKHINDCIYKKWGKNSWIYDGYKNDTYYIGTTKGSPSNNYIRIYTPPDNKRITANPVVHTEFALTRWNRISRILNIQTLYDLKSAKETFEFLEKKYIGAYEINRTKFFKHLVKIGLPVKEAKNAKYYGDSPKDFVDNIEEKQVLIRRKIHRNALNKYAGLKTKTVSRFERSFLKIDPQNFLTKVDCNIVSLIHKKSHNLCEIYH